MREIGSWQLVKKRMSRGLDFANAKSGKKKAVKEAALADSNPCDSILAVVNDISFYKGIQKMEQELTNAVKAIKNAILKIGRLGDRFITI